MADREGALERARARIEVAGESFDGLNKPKRTPGAAKKFAVAVKDPQSGDPRIVRFGDPSMEHYKGPDGKGGHGNEDRRANFRARHNCDEKTDKTTPGYWSCHATW